MNGIEVLRFGFDDAAQILEGVMQDVTQEMADSLPPNLANPIGWNYLHTATSNDWTLNALCLNQPMIWESGGWSKKLGVELPAPETGPTRAWLASTSIPLAQAREYTQAINQAVGAYIDTLAEADLDRVVYEGEHDTIGKLISTYITWHICAHTGEISALKGIQGSVGYGF